MTFPSMRGSIEEIEFDTRVKLVEHTQSLHEQRTSGEDVAIVPTMVWLQSLADLRYALKEKAL